LSTKPNIVFILTDDQGWKDLGCTGSHYYQTPHIDQMALEGMLFTQAYAAAPICSPSRGAIFTGQYPARSKYTAVIRAYVESDSSLQKESKPLSGNVQHLEGLHRHALPLNIPTIAEMLSDSDYHTGFLGKWHCGWNETHWPDKRGWDVAECFRTLPTGTKGHFGRDFLPAKCKGMDDLQEDDYMTDVLTDRAVEFIERATEKDSPFFLTLCHYAVHLPLSAPESLIEKYRELPTTDQHNPVYAAMIEKVDDSVGRINQVLKELGVEENTMVIFTSDNGGMSPNVTSNFPLLGGKSYCYEAGMRVPLIVKWPQKITPAVVEDTRVISVDLVPTWLEMAEVKVPGNTILDGESLLPLLSREKKEAERPIFFHHPHYTHAAGPFSSVIEENWKLIRFYNDTSGAEQLFDMNSDPFEQEDLSEKCLDQVQRLGQTLDQWLEETEAELPRPNEQFDSEMAAEMDRSYTWSRALSERAELEQRWLASETPKGLD
jgi:arylsulfatase A